jgi:hypothetical protein
MIKLVEVYDKSGVQSSFGLREIYINPQNVALIRPDDNTKVLLESRTGLPDGLDPRQEFTKITLSDSRSSICVVGEANAIFTKVFAAHGRRLLKD